MTAPLGIIKRKNELPSMPFCGYLTYKVASSLFAHLGTKKPFKLNNVANCFRDKRCNIFCYFQHQ